jgi:SAM-dependent methyltransferase
MKNLVRKLTDVLPTQPKVNKRISELEDSTILVHQLHDAFRQQGGFPLPPKHLQLRITGAYSPDFIKHGEQAVSDLNKMVDVRSFKRILDFGCGCARIIRALHFTRNGHELYGSDIDEEAIGWCQNNYQGMAEFYANPFEPPTKYPDGFFDLIYSISVFTHLPEDMQFRWLEELKRITRPGGQLVLTFHGKHALQTWPVAEQKMNSQEHGFLYLDLGETEGLPGFYKNAYHKHDYIRSEWGKYFEVLDIKERAVHGFQDAAVLRA